MTDLPALQLRQAGPALPEARGPGLINQLVRSQRFRALCARVPGLRMIARREGAELFDLMQGFVRAQVLAALVELDLLRLLDAEALDAPTIAVRCGIPPERAEVLAQAGAALGLLARRRDGRFGLARRGAAFLATPGLSAMVRHHAVLYRDLADPAAFFRGTTEPQLAQFWPYVFGAGAATDHETARLYSGLMTDSQAMVAEETLRQISFGSARCLMDVGGGTGAFLRAVHARYPALSLRLFDLPAVVASAELPAGAERIGGSFRDAPLPQGADTISLVRVLYDHADATAQALLASAFAALPPGGRVIISEPMSGGASPDPQTDVYFSVYTLAMQTGRTRSVAALSAMLQTVGFVEIIVARNPFPFISCCLTAKRP